MLFLLVSTQLVRFLLRCLIGEAPLCSLFERLPPNPVLTHLRFHSQTSSLLTPLLFTMWLVPGERRFHRSKVTVAATSHTQRVCVRPMFIEWVSQLTRLSRSQIDSREIHVS